MFIHERRAEHVKTYFRIVMQVQGVGDRRRSQP